MRRCFDITPSKVIPPFSLFTTHFAWNLIKRRRKATGTSQNHYVPSLNYLIGKTVIFNCLIEQGTIYDGIINYYQLMPQHTYLFRVIQIGIDHKVHVFHSSFSHILKALIESIIRGIKEERFSSHLPRRAYDVSKHRRVQEE